MADVKEKKVAPASKKIKKVPRKTTAPTRLWVKSVFLGFRRSKVNQNENQALLKLQGVTDIEPARYYQGKRCAFIYKATSKKNNTKYRAIWGTVVKPHGTNGTVIARFRSNLPPRAMGSIVRVFLYPQRK